MMLTPTRSGFRPPLTINYRVSRTCHWVYHYHSSIELHHCESGDGEYQVGGVRWPVLPSSVVLIYGPTAHQIFVRGNPRYESTIMQFSQSFAESCPNSDQIVVSSLLPSRTCPIMQFVLTPEDHQQLDALLQCTYRENQQHTAHKELSVSLYLMQILVILARSQRRNAEGMSVSAHERLVIEHIVTKVDEWLENDYSVDDIAAYFGMSPSHLRRIFRRGAGIGLGQYIADKRFGLAYRMLRRGVTITEAAIESGYQNVSSFTRAFKRKAGVPPSEVLHRMVK